jgi:hypothetical protein
MLGARIEELLEEEQAESAVVSMVTDEARQRQLVLEDDDEDFLDEGKLPTAWIFKRKRLRNTA